MHKPTAGEGYAYLTRHVAAGDGELGRGESLTAYYEQSGNPAGRWCGSGFSGLGVDYPARLGPGDRVTEAMAAVFRDGVDPFTAQPLGRPHHRYDPPAEGARVRGRQAVVGSDLTFTAPKSVSVLWGLADDATRQVVYGAHRAALADALAFVERAVIRTRVGHAGARQVVTRGMVAAAFHHWDTRASDPNLHTHVVVANRVQGPDGVWRAVDGKTVHAAVVTVSELYDALLADEVARRLPVTRSVRDRGPRRNPAFEIDGIGDDLLTYFSARSEQIHCAEQAGSPGSPRPTAASPGRSRRPMPASTWPARSAHPRPSGPWSSCWPSGPTGRGS